jgi:hypothetical protein
VAQLWPQIEVFFQMGQAEAGGDYTVDQLKMYLTLGNWLLIVFASSEKICGAMAVSFIDQPNDRVAFIPSLGGRGIVNQDVWSQVRQIIKRLGATKLQAGCRPSLVRLAKKVGFVPRCVVIEDPM